MTIELSPLVDATDFDEYDRVLADYLGGRMEEPAFVAFRLQLGVYGQRQPGLCMVRTKVPGGRLRAEQLDGFADALDRYSSAGALHVTTRQNIQFYSVPLEKTAALLRDLGSAGIATREAGGNTVRNMTACPMAGICPGEEVDPFPYIDAASRYFLRNPLTQSLPRKFKISFSACGKDCAQAVANDLGVVAVRDGERKGFRLFVGGGLGAKPHLPILLDPFVEEKDLVPSLAAVIVLHDRHSDRNRKARSRIKFLVETFGEQGFRDRYAREAARQREAFDQALAPTADWHEQVQEVIASPDAPRAPLPQRGAGRVALPVSVKGGDLSAAQLRGLRALLDEFGLDEVRTLQDQNLLIPHIRESELGRVIARLATLGLGVPMAGDNVAACPGTVTCPLGVTASSRLAKELSGGSADLRVRINGCQNSCAQSDLADVGMYGKGRRHFGKLVPTYALQIAGNGMNDPRLGFDGPEIPATRVPQAVARIHEAFSAERQPGEAFAGWALRVGSDYFDRLLEEFAQVREEELDALLRDHGDTTLFKVEAAGVGECAGVKVDPLAKLILDLRYERGLRDAFVQKRKYEQAAEHLEAMVELAMRAAAMSGESDPTAEDFLTRIARFRDDTDELEFAPLSTAIDAWVEVVRARATTRGRVKRTPLTAPPID